MVKPFWVLAPLGDTAILEATLLWGKCVEMMQQEAAACATASAAVLPVSSVSKRVALQLCAKYTDHWPVLQDLDTA